MGKLLTYFFLFSCIVGTAQPFEGNLKIENITFPEGNQLAYVYDIAQDSTGLIWMHAGSNFYIYNGNELSKVAQEVIGFHLDNINQFHSDKKHPFFYICKGSLLVYNPYAKKIVQVHAPANICLFPEAVTISYIVADEDDVLWAIVRSDIKKKHTVVMKNGKGEHFEEISPINISWYYGETLVRNGHFFVKLRDRIEEFDLPGRVKVYAFPPGQGC